MKYGKSGTSAACARKLFGAAALATTVMASAPVGAVPVDLDSVWFFNHSVVLSDVTGHSGGVVDFLGQDGGWSNKVFDGGGGLHANAWASYYFLGAAAVSVGTLNWQLYFEAPTQPLDVYLDWDVSLLVGASAILGGAGGGGQLEAWVYQDFGSPVAQPQPIGHLKNVYTDSVTAGEVTPLAHLEPGHAGYLTVSFQTGVAASTASVIGIAAEADAFGFFGFKLWADDGNLPPVPVPEPGMASLMGIALVLLARRRTAPRAVAP